jgi:hypothetical protein
MAGSQSPIVDAMSPRYGEGHAREFRSELEVLCAKKSATRVKDARFGRARVFSRTYCVATTHLTAKCAGTTCSYRKEVRRAAG